MNYLDEMFDQFAEAFLGKMKGEGDIPLRDKLNTRSLDYSSRSLHEVNKYLKRIYRTNIDISSIEYQNVVVWCGAYIGEVIRRNATMEFHWIHYEDHMKDKDQNLKNLIPYTLGTHALLVSTNTGFVTMPIKKVAMFLEEGEANNVHFYASTDISRKKTPANSSVATKTSGIPRDPWWKFW